MVQKELGQHREKREVLIMKNILSIDVEEVFHGEYVDAYRKYKLAYRTPYNIPKILKLLEKYGVKATFFVVGEIAEKYPEIVALIKERGHEVAFHGWDHTPLWSLMPEKFRKDIKMFKKICSDCIGFRAPSFSLNNKTRWALKILIEEEFRYDSSIFPVWTPLYGVYKAPLIPYYPSLEDITKEKDEGLLMEFPLTIYEVVKIRIPIAGGFWLRLWPIGLIRRGISKMNAKGYPSIIYIHNWELDPDVPKLKLNPYKSFVTYHNLVKARRFFESLLANYSFTSFKEYINAG